MNGFLLIDKPIEWTSRDVCNKVSHLFKEKKVGHAGTLDPFASGLLIVALGSATKGISFLEDNDKEYVAELTLGKKTSTGDCKGEFVEEKEIPSLTKEFILEVFLSFIGKYQQKVPMTSAVHVDGKKLYELAHKGQVVDTPFREVEIKSIDLLFFDQQTIIFKCFVSKGTYIRTLGEDIANKLGTVGYLSNLRRTKVGNHKIDKAIKLEDANDKDIKSISEILDMFDKLVVNEQLEIKIKNGMPIVDTKEHCNDKILVVNRNNAPLAVYERRDGHNYYCLRGLWS